MNNFTTPDGLALLNLLGSLPPEFGSLVTALYTHLVVRRPEVLHCWLDTANIVGGVAGLLAGVPRVILSSRSINPTNFPGLHRPWFLPWYRAIMASNRVRWIANSKHGALSYAEWIGFDPSLADHVPNGIDCAAFTSPSEAIIRDTRAKYGIEKDDCLIIGVMRFSQEKRPQRFVRLIHELRQMGKPVKGLLVGGGSLEDLVRWEVKNLGLENILHLVGIKSDIQTFMSASDILVLTSDFEGFPNVLIEGKVMGKPVVATAVGGACDIIRSGIDGYLCNPNVFAELRERVAQLVDDPSLRAQMGKEGLSHAYETFNSDRMVDRMLSCYGIPGKAVGDESEMRFARAGNLV